MRLLKRISYFQGRILLENRINRQAIIARSLSEAPNYNFIEISSLPTFHFQDSLPRLPIPQLEKTCERYLTALRPLMTDSEYSDAVKLVQKFQENEGKELHHELKRYDLINQHTSYISQPWFNMYLSDRVPLPINYNPVLVYNKSKQPDNDSQLVRATNMLISSIRFMKSLRKEILAPDVYHLNPKKSDTPIFRLVTRSLPSSLSWYGAYFFKAFPLDMSQYGNLFNSTRIPKLKKDVLYKDETKKHILVMRNGHFFVFDVFEKNGNILPARDVYTCLHYIVTKNLERNKQCLGYFTTENRDNWARSREYIESLSEANAEALKAIDTALFVLCLDDDELGPELTPRMKHFLHGNGFNRWFDKSFSLMISKDGAAGLNFEHSWGDGVAVLRYFQDIYRDTNEYMFVNSKTTTSNIDVDEIVRELNFDVDDRVTTEVNAAREKFEKTCNSLSFDVGVCETMGKRTCKTASISPDSVMQLSFQVAYHRLFGNFVSTYESCSTAAFKHGRTETIRPCTNATKEFALSLNGNNRPSRAELIEMMKKCSTVHGKLTKEAAMGEGFDRHLFGMKDLSIRLGLPVPDLFNHETYKKMNYNILSTSTLSSDAVELGGFGPVVPDGLGLGYAIRDDMCGSMVSSYPENRSGAQYAEALTSTLKDISDILNNK